MAIFEVKYAKQQERQEKSCDEVILQIDSRMYREEFCEDYSKVMCYGISFYKKTVLDPIEKLVKEHPPKVECSFQYHTQ